MSPEVLPAQGSRCKHYVCRANQYIHAGLGGRGDLRTCIQETLSKESDTMMSTLLIIFIIDFPLYSAVSLTIKIIEPDGAKRSHCDSKLYY